LQFGTPVINGCTITVDLQYDGFGLLFMNGMNVSVNVHNLTPNGNSDVSISNVINGIPIGNPGAHISGLFGDKSVNIQFFGTTVNIEGAQPRTLLRININANVGDCFELTINSFAKIINIQNQLLDIAVPPIPNDPALNPITICAGAGVNITGDIETQNFCTGTLNKMLAGADVNIHKITNNIIDQNQPIVCTSVSNLAGQHACNACGNSTYAVWPDKNDNIPCGVNSTDLNIVNDFILGNIEFNGLLQFIAADANYSGGVSVSDLLIIHRIIIGIPQAPNVNLKSWRIIDKAFYLMNNQPNFTHADYVTKFPNMNPFVLVQQNSGNISGINFWGVKSGDLNFSCTNCINTAAPENETRNLDSKQLTIDQIKNNDGSISLTLTPSSNDWYITNLNLLFNLNEYELLEIQQLNNSLMVHDYDGNNGRLSIGLNNMSKTLSTNPFVKIIALPKSSLSTNSPVILSQHDLGPTNTSLTNDNDDHPIELVYSSASSLDQLTVAPNPFISDIEVSIYSDINATGTLELFNLDGRSITTISISVTKGANKVSIHQLDNLPSGMYLLNWNCNHTLSTQKLIKF